jgi:hypothetical protein
MIVGKSFQRLYPVGSEIEAFKSLYTFSKYYNISIANLYWIKIGLVLYCLNWVILIDDNKISIKAIDWYSICLINICMKDDIEDNKNLSSVFNQVTSILNIHSW